MKNLDKNFKYFIMLLIILMLGILIFGNYDLNLSLIEGMDYTKISQTSQMTKLKNSEILSKNVQDILTTNINRSRNSAPGD